MKPASLAFHTRVTWDWYQIISTNTFPHPDSRGHYNIAQIFPLAHSTLSISTTSYQKWFIPVAPHGVLRNFDT